MRIHVLLLPDSMPLTLHIRLVAASALLLVLLCSSTSCLGTQYQDCLSNTPTCGNVEFSYPFGISGSGCGDPNFQLHSCDSDYHPLISLGGDEYHILKPSFLSINSDDHTLTLLNDNLWGDKCSLSGNYTQFWSSGSPFHLRADIYTTSTLCRETNSGGLSLCKIYIWNYSTGQPLPFCDSIPLPKDLPPDSISDTLLHEGFEISWIADPNKDAKCIACQESNGACGYNTSTPAMFLCYCPNGISRQDNCTGLDTGLLDTGRGRNKSAISIGCSIGGAALLPIAVLLSLTYYAKRRKRPPPPRNSIAKVEEFLKEYANEIPPRSSIAKVEEFLKEYAYEMPTRYLQSDLKKMTNNFAERLGEGGYGVVYKGKLRNGAAVAVKLLDRHRHSQTQFMNEVATIGRVHHINLVRLFGYCFESFTSALVYEYMLNGSLEKFIFAGKEKGQVLRWEQLSSIALGAARGIAYLHQDCEKRIIHFDIKPHNILLDSEFTPKVADFGLAELCGKGKDHISMTGARGTPGFVAPEVWSRDLGPVTDKSDVYSFGMLLLEIVGGRKNIDVQASCSSHLYFPEWAFRLLENGELGMRLRGGEMEVENAEKARRLTKVGLWCIQYNYRDRPCMSRVVQMLEGNEDVASPPLPFNSSAEPENALPSSTLTSSIEIRLETGWSMEVLRSC